MDWNSFHKSFRLNNSQFNSVNELISYAYNNDESLALFLAEWFNQEDSIIVKTSGSTGKPKEIKLKKEHVVNSAKATGLFFDLPKNTVALLCLPISYIAGKLMFIRALTLGWQLDVIPSSSNPLKEIDKQYDFSAFTPMQLENSLDKINIIKKLIVGGGAVSNILKEKFKGLKTQVFATYGMTETITHIAVKKLNNHQVTPTYYQSLPNVKLFVDSRNCLVIKAPKISDKIIFTNDVVQLTASNQFEWLGRFDNVINSGGIKLHPEIIEQKLAKVIIDRFFVTSIPDDYLGEKLVLVVEGNPYKIDFTTSNLTKFEKPKEIFFVPKLEETSSGKILRKISF